MAEHIVIFGTGALGSIVQQYMARRSPDQVVGFTVDGAYLKKDKHNDLPVVAFEELEKNYAPEDCRILVAMGYPEKVGRKLVEDKVESLRQRGYSLYSYIDTQAVIDEQVTLGENCIICPGVFIEPYTRIGDGTVVRSQAYLGHHNQVEKYCLLAPRVALAGYVTIKPYTFVGINAIVRDRITIGKNSIIGCGVTVNKDVPPNTILKAPKATTIPRRPGDILLWSESGMDADQPIARSQVYQPDNGNDL